MISIFACHALFQILIEPVHTMCLTVTKLLHQEFTRCQVLWNPVYTELLCTLLSRPWLFVFTGACRTRNVPTLSVPMETLVQNISKRADVRTKRRGNPRRRPKYRVYLKPPLPPSCQPLADHSKTGQPVMLQPLTHQTLPHQPLNCQPVTHQPHSSGSLRNSRRVNSLQCIKTSLPSLRLMDI